MTAPDILLAPPGGGRLRPTWRPDLPDLLCLWNDGRVMAPVGYPAGLGWDAGRMERWLEQVAADPRREHYVVVAGGFAGEVHFAVDADGRAALDVKLRPAARGRGLATRALAALIDRVFTSRPYARVVYTEPSDANLPAMRLYRRCGLRPARRPRSLPPADSYWAMSRERWAALRGERRHG